MIKYHRKIGNLSISELSKRTSISIEDLEIFKNAIKIPSILEIEKIANALTINIRDLLSNDKIEVVIKRAFDIMFIISQLLQDISGFDPKK